MSPIDAAPRIASVIAWARTSASEWPSRPAVVRDLDAAEDQPPPRGEAVRVDPEPGPHPSGSIRRARFSKTAISFTPQSLEQLDRLLVAVGEVLGPVGVAGERDRDARVDRHLEHRPRRVDLADRLAQPGGRDLHRDARVEHRLDRRLVVEARVLGRLRAAGAPDLDQVRVGDDVEDARSARTRRSRRSSASRRARRSSRGARCRSRRRSRRRTRRGSAPSRGRSPTRGARAGSPSGPRCRGRSRPRSRAAGRSPRARSRRSGRGRRRRSGARTGAARRRGRR